jgi:demethylmenaquinone methyltransferase / 2-methoxy-6-polyprenyl-1,4-benzoquinol methylase
MAEYQKDNPETIQAMFGSIAKQYDRTNGALSFQLHRRWNRSLIKTVQNSTSCNQILDLCCGTGEIAFGILKNSEKPSEAFLLDFCSEMLIHAKEKAQKLDLKQHKLHYIQADAQQIPLPDASVDYVTVAYGIRNVKDPFRCAKEAYRVLRKGGGFSILELTQPENFLLRLGHSLYLKTFVPVLGKLLTSNREAYAYLQNSIKTFIPPKDLEKLLQASSFQQISRQSLTGGTATIISGIKE